MSRPVIKNERREQILDAFEACVARYGVEGATLARTAEEAGLARPLIRHNVGNRDDLLEALVERFAANSRAAMHEMIAALPSENRLQTLVAWLFDPNYSDARLVQVSNALVAASADDPVLAEKMRNWINDFVTHLERVLSSAHPKTPPERATAVAAGLAGIYFNVEALNPLGDIKTLTAASKDAALLLIASLENTK